MRPLRYLSGRTPSPVPAEARQRNYQPQIYIDARMPNSFTRMAMAHLMDPRGLELDHKPSSYIGQVVSKRELMADSLAAELLVPQDFLISVANVLAPHRWNTFFEAPSMLPFFRLLKAQTSEAIMIWFWQKKDCFSPFFVILKVLISEEPEWGAADVPASAQPQTDEFTQEGLRLCILMGNHLPVEADMDTGSAQELRALMQRKLDSGVLFRGVTELMTFYSFGSFGGFRLSSPSGKAYTSQEDRPYLFFYLPVALEVNLLRSIKLDRFARGKTVLPTVIGLRDDTERKRAAAMKRGDVSTALFPSSKQLHFTPAGWLEWFEQVMAIRSRIS